MEISFIRDILSFFYLNIILWFTATIKLYTIVFIHHSIIVYLYYRIMFGDALSLAKMACLKDTCWYCNSFYCILAAQEEVFFCQSKQVSPYNCYLLKSYHQSHCLRCKWIDSFIGSFYMPNTNDIRIILYTVDINEWWLITFF